MKAEIVRIDKAGRLVLPKPLRDRFNLLPGDKLRLLADATGVRLEPMDGSGGLAREGTVLVFTGEFNQPVSTGLVEKLLNEDRERNVAETARMIRKK